MKGGKKQVTFMLTFILHTIAEYVHFSLNVLFGICRMSSVLTEEKYEIDLLAYENEEMWKE